MPGMSRDDWRRDNLLYEMSTTTTGVKKDRRRSREIFARAEKVLVGGVNSPVRAFRAVGGEPLIIERGSGQYLYDVDGYELLDRSEERRVWKECRARWG